MRQKARQRLASPGPNVAELVKAWQPALGLGVKALDGMAIFRQASAKCHTCVGKEGITIGPDLSTIRNRSRRATMEDILLPGKPIADGWRLLEIALNNRKTMTGRLTAQAIDALTPTDLTGRRSNIQRSNIQTIPASEYSAMPSCLKNQVDQ